MVRERDRRVLSEGRAAQVCRWHGTQPEGGRACRGERCLCSWPGESVQGKAGCWPGGTPAGQGCSGRLSSENGSAGNLVLSCCKSSIIIQNFRIHMQADINNTFFSLH